jgi:hypothetical protein
MRNSATLAIQGERLPSELFAALEGSEAGAVYSVHVKKLSVEDAAEFLETRAKVPRPNRRATKSAITVRANPQTIFP